MLPDPRIPTAVLAGGFALLAAAETLAPLRPRTQPRLRRTLRNAGTAAIALALAAPLRVLLLVPLAAWLESRGIGLLHLVEAPPLLELLFALLLLDWTLWYWHWANHRLPLLWRFHAVHHEDKDLDASTALRFHFGELGLSVGWRALQVLFLGARPEHLTVHAAVLGISTAFHHANLRLPLRLERALVRFVVTPRMHGIHHSTVARETNSNYSSLLSAWDRLHRTLCLNVPQGEVSVGLPGGRGEAEGLWQLQARPFRGAPERVGDWSAGRSPEPPGPCSRLAG